MGRPHTKTYTYDDMLQHINILIEIDAGTWTPPENGDLRPLVRHIAARYVSIAVTNKGRIKVALSKRGREALERGRAALQILQKDNLPISQLVRPLGRGDVTETKE